jgi:glycosidase
VSLAALVVHSLIFFLGRSLNTESSSVRAKISGHANDLISLGVDGLRVDAAKRVLSY